MEIKILIVACILAVILTVYKIFFEPEPKLRTEKRMLH